MSNRTAVIRSGKDFGRTVAECRHANGLTQDALADLAGLSTAYVSKIESGRTSSLLEHELRILRRLGATVTVTFQDATTPNGEA